MTQERDTWEELRESRVEAAASIMRDALADGPRWCAEVRAIAEARGLRFDDTTWNAARRRVGAETIRVGRRFVWKLAGDAIEDELRAWLSTPQGAFAVYVAERDRLCETTPVGAQLAW